MIEIALIIIVFELFFLVYILWKIFNSENLAPKSLNEIILRRQNEVTIEEHNTKYKNTGLSEPLRLEYKQKLINWFEEHRPYLNPNLKLADVSKEMNLSTNQTSQLINQSFEMDFNSYVNSYRIEYAIDLFKNGAFKNICDVIYDSGFNNATTFNNAFKKTTGMTPSYYLTKLNRL
jgi:AraC-like DNA-binding protein